MATSEISCSQPTDPKQGKIKSEPSEISIPLFQCILMQSRRKEGIVGLGIPDMISSAIANTWARKKAGLTGSIQLGLKLSKE